MNCINPPALTDRQLIEYFDAESPPQIAEHLADCDFCREQASRLGLALNRLTTQLYRADCPSSNDLGEYQMQLLPETQTKAIQQHLKQCPHCSSELADLEAYFQELVPEIEYSFVEQIKVKVAKLVSDLSPSGMPQLNPTFAVRGDEGGSFLYEIDDAQIALDVQDDDENPDLKVMYGIITGLDVAPLRVQLWQNDQQVVTADVDDLFTFHVSRLAAGTYNVVLRGTDVEIHIQDVPV
ncbi:MAG: hypothetical protein AAF629_32510 [Chloroflexota bacterium]